MICWFRERVLWVFPFISMGHQKRCFSLTLKPKEEVSRRSPLLYLKHVSKKKNLASNALAGYLLKEWTSWSSLNTYLSRVKRELGREGKMRQLHVVWFDKDKRVFCASSAHGGR